MAGNRWRLQTRDIGEMNGVFPNEASADIAQA
jgi:hypothetical protein